MQNYLLLGLIIQLIVILTFALDWVRNIKTNENDYKQIWFSSLTYFTQQINLLIIVTVFIFFFNNKAKILSHNYLLCWVSAYSFVSLFIFNFFIFFNAFKHVINSNEIINLSDIKPPFSLIQLIFLYEVNPIYVIVLFILQVKFFNNEKKNINFLIKSPLYGFIYPLIYLVYVTIIPFITAGYNNFSVYGMYTNCCKKCFFQKNSNDPLLVFGSPSNIIYISFAAIFFIFTLILFSLIDSKYCLAKTKKDQENKKNNLEEEIQEYLWTKQKNNTFKK